MKIKPIIVVAGEPNSIFLEIFFKSLKFRKYRSPLILICCKKNLIKQMKVLNYKKKLRLLDSINPTKNKLDNKMINLINVEFKKNKTNNYIKRCFKIAFTLIKNNISKKLINGPINKNNFLNKKYLGITEYISDKFNKKKFAMLIYNKNLSVCPLTTHLPLSLVSKNISKKLINEKIHVIDNFYKKNFGFRPKVGITGLNPHCESILKFNEDSKIILSAIKSLKNKRYKVDGPFPADTIFLKKNRKIYDVILGMYHDQVLTPFKTLFEYDAINITIGLPFLRVTPDHGPNQKMVGKNLSNPKSLLKALTFLDQK
tara:strand:+ start:766 stop:1707 length:942 start_codon:yes stop_codon:yes gene_type:complete